MSRFDPGLGQVRGACHAWLQPDGGWGLSNAGLVVGQGSSLLIDTLFDLDHTQRMLDGMRALTDPAPIATVVNTHGNGDHWFGNELVPGAEIIAAAPTLEDMRAVGPAQLVALTAAPGPTGDYARRIFGRYRFDDITPIYPTVTFDGRHSVSVGGVEVHLIDLGPAHTRGDTIVHCPEDGVVYTGDLVFAGGTPIMWTGPAENWIRACERIAGLGADLIVPGHGPVSSTAAVRQIADYLAFVREKAGAAWEAGIPIEDAIHTFDLGPWAALPESERIAANVVAIYHQLGGDAAPQPTGPFLFGCMAHRDGQHHTEV